MDKVVFTGCSFTAGAGWGEIDTADPSLRDIRDHSNLYVSLCHTNLSQLKNLEVVNYGQIDSGLALVSSYKINPEHLVSRSVEHFEPSVKAKPGDQTLYRVNPNVCIGVVAFNNTPGEHFGERVIAHLLPTGHLYLISARRTGFN